MLAAITWSVSPEIFDIWIFSVRWYGILFALPFLIGYYLVAPMFNGEGRKREDLDTLVLYMIVATVVGARLGHCLFYEPTRYLADPISILRIWEGGLASHGAAIGIVIGMWLFARKRAAYSFWWLADRIVMVVALAGVTIRLGNFFNSEIYGTVTDLPWGVVFTLANEKLPRHPTQLYESLAYGLIFIFLWLRHKRFDGKPPASSQFAIFLTLTFLARFLIEFVKLEQGGLDDATLPLRMGQLLSIPFILLGLYLWRRSSSRELKTS